MTHDEFIGAVQSRAQLASRGDAERAVRATLETFADRLEADSADNLASELPSELARHLRQSQGFERLTLDEFFARVHERETPSVDLPKAAYHARVVTEVLSEAVSAGQMDKLRKQLPEEFAPLFDSGSKGPMTRQ
jgi:uncharacterized protein (DUF2267 family)